MDIFKDMKRKITYITGTRADYGRMIPTLRMLKNDSNFELSIIATGMHLLQDYGYTVEDIENDFGVTNKIDMMLASDTNAAMAKSLGIGIVGITQVLEEKQPDIILLLGDRGEMLAGAIAGAHLNIPVAHIGGGQTTGGSTIDESIRHAITKFSHIHFVATKSHAKRLCSMGEKPENVHVVGAPDLDAISNLKLSYPSEIAKKYGLNLSKPIILFIQHPTTTTPLDNENNFKISMDAITELNYQTIVIYPNSDAGNRSGIEIIKRCDVLPFIKSYKNIPYIDFLNLMSIASVMVGNSSSGIIEAPSFKLPVVNIGNRQQYRDRAINIIDVGHNRIKIKKAIECAISDDFKVKIKNCENLYGDGNTYKKISKILSKVEISLEILKKKWCDEKC